MDLYFPPGTPVYIICRSNSIADRWAIRNGIKKDDMRFRYSLDAFTSYDSRIVVLLQENDSLHFREDIGRNKIKFPKITVVWLD